MAKLSFQTHNLHQDQAHGVTIELSGVQSLDELESFLETARQLGKNVFSPVTAPVSIASASQVLAIVAKHFGVAVEAMQSPVHKSKGNDARQVAAYLVRLLVTSNKSSIARMLGYSTHVSAGKAIKAIEDRLTVETTLQEVINKLISELPASDGCKMA